jgi:hypothetical protein
MLRAKNAKLGSHVFKNWVIPSQGNLNLTAAERDAKAVSFAQFLKLCCQFQLRAP